MKRPRYIRVNAIPAGSVGDHGPHRHLGPGAPDLAVLRAT